MEYKRVGDTVLFRLDSGEELVSSIENICSELSIESGWVQGIGAADKLTIGVFETKQKKYHKKTVNGDHEIAPLMGNISTKQGNVYLHLHINVCDSSNKALCGHLNEAVISATFEGRIDIFSEKVKRVFDEHSGLNLMKF